jgi:hypothetical protein
MYKDHYKIVDFRGQYTYNVYLSEASGISRDPTASIFRKPSHSKVKQ